MAKKAMPAPRARKSLEQLRSTVWPTERAALADLKVSQVPPSGPDYELNETQSGWQLIAFEHEPAPEVGREQRVINSLKRKPGVKPKHEPEVIAHAKKPAQKKAAKPPSAKAPVEPVETVSLFADVEEAPVVETPPAPLNPFAPLPSNGDYEIVIRAADGSFPNNSVVSWAVGFSKRNKCRVHIRLSGGETVRSFDVAAIKAAQKGRGRPTKDGSARSTGKSAAAAKLFMRPQGATFNEVVKITEWGISERFVNRLARANKCSVEKLGEKNFRLIKPTS